MIAVNKWTANLDALDVVQVFDDFIWDQSDLYAIDTVTDSGTAAVGDAQNGVMVLTPSDGTVADNDEVYIATPNELFLFGTDRKIYGRCRLQYAETTATVGSVAFGFQNAVGANSIVDDTGLPKTSGSTLAIYKPDNGHAWVVCSACNGTATHTTSNLTATAAAWHVLEIECEYTGDSTYMRVTFKVDGQILRDANRIPITHFVAIASATEMALFVGRKLGAATNNDTVSVDYWYAAQTRI